MNLELILIFFLGVGCFSFIFYILKSKKHQNESLQQQINQLTNQIRQNLDGNTQIIQQQIHHLTSQVDQKLSQTHSQTDKQTQNINERLDKASKVIGELQHKLGSLEQSNQKIYEVGQDIQSLQQILQNPKIRGGLGELFLERLLAEILPKENYETQYGFKNHEKVDAVIKIEDRLIPIDAKFPLDSFKRYLEEIEPEKKTPHYKTFINDVKKQIQSIAKKYILPEENTFDFALMYIPSEQVYYEIMLNDSANTKQESLTELARKLRIIIVSPNSFYAYLSALMQALRGQKMQKNIHEIMNQLRHITLDIEKINDDFQKIGYHLSNAQKSYESTDKRINKYQDKLGQLHQFEEIEEKDKSVKLIAG